MNEFKKEYLDLLKKQAEEEIYFLMYQGHANSEITIPCPFCYERPYSNKFRCNRISELERFLKFIIDKTKSSNLYEKQQEKIKEDNSLNLIPLLQPL